jgi:hypothetical protein
MAVNNNIVKVLTDFWSDSVAQELRRLWPDRQLEVWYLSGEAENTEESGCHPPIKAALLDPDVSRISLPDGTRFAYALYAHSWELTKLFRAVLKESLWVRLIGRFYSSRNAEVLYLRNFYGRIHPLVFLCLFARHLDGAKRDREASVTVYLSSKPFDSRIVSYLKKIYSPIIVYPELAYGETVYRTVRYVVGNAYREARRLIQRPQDHSQESGACDAAPWLKSSRKDSRRAVTVQACLGLEPEHERSDLFWFPHSGIPGSRVAVYFDRPDRPASIEALATVQKYRWKPEILYSEHDGAHPAKIITYRDGLEWCRLMLALCCFPLLLFEKRRLLSTAFWCWHSITNSTELAATWKGFFESRGTLVHSNSSDLGMSHHVDQSVALEWCGGINLRTEVSFDYSPITKFGASILPFDVFFVWGSYMASAFQEREFPNVTTLITCGYPFDYLFEGARQRGDYLRCELKAAGAQKILCFFDSSFSKTSFTSGDEVKNIYRLLLTEVSENPKLGLILKPKNTRSETVLDSTELKRLLDRALATGRCVMLETKSIMHWVSPCEGALASDMTVGYPINSAVIEAALSGVPSVHIDLTKHHSHSFYEKGYEKIVFDDLERAMEAIRRWIRNPTDEPGLGDHSIVIDQIDPFRDGKAAMRMGQYIGWLLESLDRGLGRDEAVRRVSRLYAEKYGRKYVDLSARLGHL